MEGIKMRQNTKNVSPMSNEGRNQYVVEHITDALLKLMKSNDFNVIQGIIPDCFILSFISSLNS